MSLEYVRREKGAVKFGQMAMGGACDRPSQTPNNGYEQRRVFSIGIRGVVRGLLRYHNKLRTKYIFTAPCRRLLAGGQLRGLSRLAQAFYLTFLYSTHTSPGRIVCLLRYNKVIGWTSRDKPDPAVPGVKENHAYIYAKKNSVSSPDDEKSRA